MAHKNMEQLCYLLGVAAIILMASCQNGNRQDSVRMPDSNKVQRHAVNAQQDSDLEQIPNNLLINPQENMRVACLVNPTMYYHTEHYYTIWLLENMVKTGRYSYIYLDIPALLGMVYDDYINGRENISLNDIDQFCVYDHALYMTHDDVLRLLSCLKGINSTLKRKVSIKGLNYGFDETLYPLAEIYGQQKVLINKLVKMTTGMSDEQSILQAYKEFNDYLLQNESSLRKNINGKYSIYKRMSELMLTHGSKSYTRKSDMDSLLFDNFNYLCSMHGEGEKSILYLGPFQMREESQVTSFRMLLKDRFTHDQYVIYNILDDKNHQQIKCSETDISLMGDYYAYLNNCNKQNK